MLGFDTDGNIKLFFVRLGKILLYALGGGFALYFLPLFASWILYPFLPKYEDFKSNEERNKYFDSKEIDNLLWLYIYLVIVFTLVFSDYLN